MRIQAPQPFHRPVAQPLIRDGLVDLDTSDVETVAAAPVDEVRAAAMVPGSRVSTAIVRAQTTAAVAAAGDTLQECAAFSHGAT